MRKSRTGMFLAALLTGAVSAVLLATPAFGGPSALSGANPIAVARSLIGGEQVKDSSITGADIKDGSLTRADLGDSVARSSARRRGSRGPRGPRGFSGANGAHGAQGAQGPQGPAGIQRIFAVDGAWVSIPPGYLDSAEAYCPAGSTVVGTGFYADIGDIAFAKRYGTFVGIVVINRTSITIDIQAQAVCGQVAAGVSASARRTASRGASQREFEQDVKQLESRLAE